MRFNTVRFRTILWKLRIRSGLWLWRLGRIDRGDKMWECPNCGAVFDEEYEECPECGCSEDVNYGWVGENYGWIAFARPWKRAWQGCHPGWISGNDCGICSKQLIYAYWWGQIRITNQWTFWKEHQGEDTFCLHAGLSSCRDDLKTLNKNILVSWLHTYYHGTQEYL